MSALRDAISDPNKPIGMRMRAAYYLRHYYDINRGSTSGTNRVGDDEEGKVVDDDICQSVVDVLSKGLLDERHGSLMRHEFAYVLGQLRDDRCCDTLEKVLVQPTDCVMVRHEAAEALGAIGARRSEPVLRDAMEANSGTPEISETCQLALNVMAWRESGSDPKTMPAACACMLNPYSSVDPAPPNPLHANLSFDELGNILLDKDRPIFERYRAMFSLRNRGGELAVQQLCKALTTDDSSALLRHEVAYVLGQMQHPSSVEALAESLRRRGEHEMVRHESAEALGAIDGRWDDVEKILVEFMEDDCVVVRESCAVALDAADYWGHDTTTGTGDALEDKEEVDNAESFAHQKAGQRVLVGHFNVKD